MAKIEIPAVPASAKTKKELETPKTTSSEPSLRRSGRKKTKEPSPESEEEEAESSEEEVESSGKEPEMEEEAKPAIPPPEKKKRIETRAFDRKKPAFAFKTPVSLKRPTNTPKKGESS